MGWALETEWFLMINKDKVVLSLVSNLSSYQWPIYYLGTLPSYRTRCMLITLRTYFNI